MSEGQKRRECCVAAAAELSSKGKVCRTSFRSNCNKLIPKLCNDEMTFFPSKSLVAISLDPPPSFSAVASPA